MILEFENPGSDIFLVDDFILWGGLMTESETYKTKLI